MTDEKSGVREMEVEMAGDGIIYRDRDGQDAHLVKKLTGSNLDE